MLGTFPNDFPQITTSQGYFHKWQLPKCGIYQTATSQVCPSRSDRPPLQPTAPQRAKPNLWEVATWEIAHLGVSLGKMPLGKYLTPKVLPK